MRDQPAPPAKPAPPRSPWLVGNDACALAKRFVGVTVNRTARTGKIIARHPFRAKMRFNRRNCNLGCFRLAESAARAYDSVAVLLPGRALNFPSAGAEQSSSSAASEAEVLAAIAAALAGSDSSMRSARAVGSIEPDQNGDALGGDAPSAVRPPQRASDAAPLRARADAAARKRGHDARATASSEAAGDGDEARPPASRPRPLAPAAPVPPPLSRADLLVRVRVHLRLARIDDATLGIEGMSDGGLRALLDDVLAAPPSAR